MNGAPERPRVARVTRIIRYNRCQTKDSAILALAKRLIHAILATFGLCFIFFGVANIVRGGPPHGIGASTALIVGLAFFWHGFAAFVNSFPNFAVFAARQRGFFASLLDRIMSSTWSGSYLLVGLAVGISEAATAYTAAFVEHRPPLSFGVWEPLVVAAWFLGSAFVTRRRASVEAKPVASA